MSVTRNLVERAPRDERGVFMCTTFDASHTNDRAMIHQQIAVPVAEFSDRAARRSDRTTTRKKVVTGRLDSRNLIGDNPTRGSTWCSGLPFRRFASRLCHHFFRRGDTYA